MADPLASTNTGGMTSPLTPRQRNRSRNVLNAATGLLTAATVASAGASRSGTATLGGGTVRSSASSSSSSTRSSTKTTSSKPAVSKPAKVVVPTTGS